MDIPRKIHFMGQDFKVIEEAKHTAKEGMLGEIDYIDQLIYIHKYLALDMKRETLLHECIHLIDRIFDLELEETQVKRLSHGLYGLLVDSNLGVIFKQNANRKSIAGSAEGERQGETIS